MLREYDGCTAGSSTGTATPPCTRRRAPSLPPPSSRATQRCTCLFPEGVPRPEHAALGREVGLHNPQDLLVQSVASQRRRLRRCTHAVDAPSLSRGRVDCEAGVPESARRRSYPFVIGNPRTRAQRALTPRPCLRSLLWRVQRRTCAAGTGAELRTETQGTSNKARKRRLTHKARAGKCANADSRREDSRASEVQHGHFQRLEEHLHVLLALRLHAGVHRRVC